MAKGNKKCKNCKALYCFPHPVMMLMMVMIFFIRDQREDRFHQIEVVDPGHQHQHLGDVVWKLSLVGVTVVAGFARVHVQT